MPKSLFTVAAVAALAGAAHAQLDPSRFGLEVVPVWRTYTDNGDGTSTAFDLGTPNAVVDTRLQPARLRLELRYRITVAGSSTGDYVGADGTTYSSGGLAAVALDVRLSHASAGVQLSTAPAGNSGINTGTGHVNPDPQVDPGSGFGLYAPWRTGVIPTDATFFGNNGTLVGGTAVQNILPLATSAPNQRSAGSAAAPTRTWSFYALDLSIPAGYSNTLLFNEFITFTVDRTSPNGTTGPWLFFPRLGQTNASTPVESAGPFTAGGPLSLTILGIPSPGAGAAISVAGLIAARQRRR